VLPVDAGPIEPPTDDASALPAVPKLPPAHHIRVDAGPPMSAADEARVIARMKRPEKEQGHRPRRRSRRESAGGHRALQPHDAERGGEEGSDAITKRIEECLARFVPHGD
jgi:hypothetical protein